MERRLQDRTEPMSRDSLLFMSETVRVIRRLRERARAGRADIFRKHFALTPSTTVLDLGSADGSHIAQVIRKTPIKPENVFIADIRHSVVLEGQRKFGFTPVYIPKHGRLPFENKAFDVVFSSSVIEHATGPKTEMQRLRGQAFRTRAISAQQEFAAEIRRLGNGYFVQTPNKWFPIESHSLLPLVGYLPHELLVPILSLTNRFWIKKTILDWRLLTEAEMKALFPDAQILAEKFMGLTKSLIALKPLNR